MKQYYYTKKTFCDRIIVTLNEFSHSVVKYNYLNSLPETKLE